MTGSDIDVLLGAMPQRRLSHWVGVAALAVATVIAFLLFERFVNGPASPWYSATVEQGDLAPVVHVDAALLASDETTLTATQDGLAQSVAGPDFRTVARGEVLVNFDARAAVREMAGDRAAMNAAQADLDAAQFGRTETAARLARFEDVWRKSGGRVPSLDEMENARLNARRAATAVDDAQARIVSVALQLADARNRASGAVLRAPFAGVIVARHVAPGQFVRAGTPLVTMTDRLDHLLVRASLGGTTASALPRTVEASMLVPAMPRAVRKVRLVRTEPGQGDVWQAYFGVDGAAATELRPGMRVQLEIPLPAHHDVLLVPNAALDFVPPGAGHAANTVYVQDRDGQARVVHVAVGGTDGRRTEVAGPGLEAGMDVITGPREPAPSRTDTGGKS